MLKAESLEPKFKANLGSKLSAFNIPTFDCTILSDNDVFYLNRFNSSSESIQTINRIDSVFEHPFLMTFPDSPKW